MNGKTFMRLICLAIFMSAQTAVFAQTVEVLVKTAEAAIEKKDYDAALKSVNQALAKQPSNAAALTQRARINLSKGNNTEAIADADRAIASAPNVAKNYYVRGTIYQSLKNYPKAIEDFSKAINLDANDAEFYANRAQSYVEKVVAANGKIDDPLILSAQADAEKSLSLNPKNWRALFYRAIISINKGDQLSALKDFLAVRRENPSHPEPDNFFRDRNWKNIPDNLLLEAFDPILEKYKSAYRKDIISYDKQSEMEFFFRKIPASYAASNPAKYTYLGYLNSLLAADPKNPCLNHYIFVKKYLETTRYPQLLDQYETEATNILASAYDPKYAPCAAQMAISVAGRFYDKISSATLVSTYVDNQNAAYFSKSLAWATKANQIVYQSADGFLNTLDNLLTKNLDEFKRRNPPSSLTKEQADKVGGEYANRKGQIRAARAAVPPSWKEERTAATKRLVEITDEAIRLIEKRKESLLKYLGFRRQYDEKYAGKSIAIRILDGKEYYMTADERARFLESKKDFESFLVEYKNLLAKLEGEPKTGAEQVRKLMDVINSEIGEVNKILTDINYELKSAGI